MSVSIADLRAHLSAAMLADQRRFRALIETIDLRDRRGQPVDRSIDKLQQDMKASIDRRRRRLSMLPKPMYPSDLPVVQRKEDIARAIAEHQVVVICGETGSGKTTQLPKICLELGRGVAGLIGHTQPRRIAARSVATRVAQELGSSLGNVVGYKVRFGDKTTPDTYVKVMTDGILLAEVQGDPLLEQYDTIIIDEAHERSLNIDFLMGIIKRILPQRPDLKLIITSATIDPQRFAKHFGTAGVDAPIIEVSGRMYPVEVRYRPMTAATPDEDAPDLEEAVLRAVDELLGAPRHHAERSGASRRGGGEDAPGESDRPVTPSEGPRPSTQSGDVLVFLSGEREIREIAEALRKHHPPQTEVVPLYARLSAAEQMRVFEPHKGRRIVLATNVAETSLTVPGIRYVIDPGHARVSRYSTRTKVQRLPVEAISQAAADQRKGRCGRVGPGVCIRLYSEEDYNDRPRFTEPEVLRTNLANVILQMKSMQLGEVVDFPFVDPPESRSIRDGYETLHELGAVDEVGELTASGKELAKLPVDPRIGRMLLAARDGDCLAEMLIIAAALSVQDPRDRPLDKQDDADAAHRRYITLPGDDERAGDAGAPIAGTTKADPRDASDFVTLLNMWRAFRAVSEHLSHSKLRKWCHQQYLSFVRMREWQDVHTQLHAQVAEMGMQSNSKQATEDSLHYALLTGLLGNVGCKSDAKDAPPGEYLGTRASRFFIFPGSALHRHNPKWIVAAEIVLTTRMYARMVVKVQPVWIEKLAGHLVKRTYSEPVWNSDRARVEAFEKVTLFGLEIVPKRTVHFGPINPVVSRDLFIHHALVEGEYFSRAPFYIHNAELIVAVRAMEARSRTPNLLASVERRQEFFDKRLPPDILDGGRFENWRRHAERENPKLLYMTMSDVIDDEDAAKVTQERFPNAIALSARGDSGGRVPLSYKMEPGHPDDGVTALVPIEAINELSATRAEWLVPGMLKEKIIEMLRLLPKEYRVRFVPAPEHAERAIPLLAMQERPLTAGLADALEELTGVVVPEEAWRLNELPEHLRMNFAAVDRKGKRVASGRDLDELKAQLRTSLRAALGEIRDQRYNRDTVTQWDFGDLAERVEVVSRNLTIVGYPAIVDAGAGGRSAPNGKGATSGGGSGAAGAATGHASLRLMDTPDAAIEISRGGVRRLYAIQVHKELSFLLRNFPGFQRMAMQFLTLGSMDQFRVELFDFIVDRAFLAGREPIRTESQFRKRLDPGWCNLSSQGMQCAKLVEEILAMYQPAAEQVGFTRSDPHGGKSNLPELWAHAAADIRDQLSHLMHTGFLVWTPTDWLVHYPRYLSAIRMRLQKLQTSGPARDARGIADIEPLWREWQNKNARARQMGITDPTLDQARWMIEELRVSLFAQELRTATPVSPKRVAELMARIRVR